MKNSLPHLKRGAIILLAVVVMLISSCEGGDADMSGFPNTQTIECSAGDMPSLSFKVNDAWHISSSAIWCTMLTPTGEVYDISGSAGTHTITLKISDEVIQFEQTSASITMRMGGKEAVIANIVRAAEAYTLSLYDSDGNKCEVIELGCDTFTSFSIETNFRFAATAYPEWMEFKGGSVTGGRGERVESAARIVANGDRERFAFGREAGHFVTFSDESGEHQFEIPVVFNGMSEDQITIIGPTSESFGWEVSLDGSTYRHTDDHSSYDGELTYKITARNDEYEVVCIEMLVERGIPRYIIDAEWIEYDRTTSTIEIKPTTETRYGVVMAFPMGVYNDIKDDIKDAIVELDYTTGIGIETIKYEMLKYMLIDFVQRDFSELDTNSGVYAYHSLTAYEIPCTVCDDAVIMAEYGVSEAYTCPFVNSVEGKKPGLIIDPRIEGWDSAAQDSGIATAELWYKGAKLKISENEYYMGENKDERLAIHLWGPKSDFTESVYVVFELNGVAKKLLIVTPPAK